MTDVDAVNERINGLVNLLHVVGIDGANSNAVADEQKRMNGMKSSTPATSQTSGASDNQILEIIRKLQQAQADSPEILAALQSPELRALASLAAQRQQTAAPASSPSLDDVMDDDDDNYPKIGPGYSDDISVVSDLTTPTVMTRQQVAEEEHYRDVNSGPGAMPPMNIALGPAQPSRPPMNIGGGNMMAPGMSNLRNPPKTKNLVSQVRPGATRRAIAAGKAGINAGAGGAAAQRRHNYQQAMAKLQSTGAPNDYGNSANGGGGGSGYAAPDSFFPSAPSNVPDPMDLPSMAESSKKNRVLRKPGQKTRTKKSSLASQDMQDTSFDDSMASGGSRGSGGGGGLSRKKSGASHGSGSRGNDLDWGTSHGSNDMVGTATGWPSFDAKPSKKKGGSKDKDIFVDSDGFFASDAFGSGGDPFASSSGKSRDDGQGGSRSRRAKAPDNSWESEKASKKEREKKSKGRGRRASLSM